MLSGELENCINAAFQQGREARHEYVTVEHLLLSLLDSPRVREVLRACGADLRTLRQDLNEHLDQSTPRIEDGQEREVQPTLGFQRVLQRAVFHVQSSGKKEVGVANVLISLLSEKQSHAVFLLQKQRVTRLDVVNYISHGLSKLAERTAQLVQQMKPPDESAQDAAAGQLIESLLAQALTEQASQIHIEPLARGLAVRFRVHGALRKVLESEHALAPRLIPRLQAMSGLDTRAACRPQESRVRLTIAGTVLDVRVATIPSSHGERAVLHLESGPHDLAALGMDRQTAQRLLDLVARPRGLLLVAGPAGSGRTTSLYAALAHLDSERLNIMTVEEPVERLIEGLSQIPVSAELPAARALEAVLRQDPDVVMIDELKDRETARLAVEASRGRRRVLASLTAGSAAGAIRRLADLGIAPELIASCLSGVLAQRLVRVLDPEAREAYPAGPDARRFLNLAPGEPAPTLYRPRDTDGYRGFTGLYELIVVDDALRTLIRDGMSEQELEHHARRTAPGLREAGRAKVRQGRTSIDEVLRVLRPD